MKRRLYTLSKQCDINIEQVLFLQETDEWTCKIATNTKEAVKLIGAAFEYVTEINRIKLFKKCK